MCKQQVVVCVYIQLVGMYIKLVVVYVQIVYSGVCVCVCR